MSDVRGLTAEQLAKRVRRHPALIAAVLADERERGRVEQVDTRWRLTASGRRELGGLFWMSPYDDQQGGTP